MKRVLKDEPFFSGIDIEPYIYLSGKPPEEVLVFDESVLNELLSGDFVKIERAESTIKNMSDSDKQRYLDITISKLKDKDGVVRGKVPWALVAIGDAKAVEPLKGALKDKYAFVRTRAAWALGRIGDAKAVEPLIEALKDKDEHVRRNAAEALRKIGDVKAVEPLIDALKDKDAGVRGSVAEALVRIGNAKAIEPLTEAVNDESIYVRRIAKRALKEIKAKTKIKVEEAESVRRKR
ncbi:MAG: HEAT repeat domain-containing protein [Methanophagales archaeon]|nr:HEAT repeat domain-containing protein [Methanophagales archaeon]